MAGNTIGLFSGAARKQVDGFRPRLALSLFVLRILPSYAFGGLRVRLLRFAGVRVGIGSGVGGSVWVAGGPDPARRLSIGDRCFVNDGCRFDTFAPITLEDDVHLGHDVAVLTATHEIGAAAGRAGRNLGMPIRIERRA
jgi:acetyltransferase-like isoleucine patch superfamily enzyme